MERSRSKDTKKKKKNTSTSKSKSKKFEEKEGGDFESDFLLIQEMRQKEIAPVSTMMSCIENIDDFQVKKYQALVALLLSPQTKDIITIKVMKRMIDKGLTIEAISKLSEEEIKILIAGVSFHNTKAKNLLKMTEIIKDEYKGKSPEEFDEIIKLPGIGQKIAYIYLSNVLKKNEGIGVDTHIHKIANRLEWVDNTKTPEKTRVELEKIVPKKYWGEMFENVAGFGQNICKTANPLCDECLLKPTCPYYKSIIDSKSKAKSKSPEKEEIIDSDKRSTPKKKSKIKYSEE